jgi:hypothetical protein
MSQKTHNFISNAQKINTDTPPAFEPILEDNFLDEDEISNIEDEEVEIEDED